MTAESSQTPDTRPIGGDWSPISSSQLDDAFLCVLGWNYYDGWIMPSGDYIEREDQWPDLSGFLRVAEEYAAHRNKELELERDGMAGLLERIIPHIYCTEDCYTTGIGCTCNRDKLLDEIQAALAGRGEDS